MRQSVCLSDGLEHLWTQCHIPTEEAAGAATVEATKWTANRGFGNYVGRDCKAEGLNQSRRRFQSAAGGLSRFEFSCWHLDTQTSHKKSAFWPLSRQRKGRWHGVTFLQGGLCLWHLPPLPGVRQSWGSGGAIDQLVRTDGFLTPRALPSSLLPACTLEASKFWLGDLLEG